MKNKKKINYNKEISETEKLDQSINSITKDDIDKATEILNKYKEGKANFEKRIIDNEQWFKMRHLESGKSENDEFASAWLFNSIANKHADAMDNYPRVNCLPREESDKEAAGILSEILSVVFERNDFEKIYSDTWWYKLKAGTGVYGIFWNPKKQNGLGNPHAYQLWAATQEIKEVIIIEGSYSLHQNLKDFYNLKIFLTSKRINNPQDTLTIISIK